MACLALRCTSAISGLQPQPIRMQHGCSERLYVPSERHAAQGCAFFVLALTFVRCLAIKGPNAAKAIDKPQLKTGAPCMMSAAVDVTVPLTVAVGRA